MSTPETTTKPRTTTKDSNLLLGRYELIRKIGEGGMGMVHLAHDVLIHRDVALKRMHYPTRGLAERFRREYRALAAIEHTGVPKIFDVGVSATGEAYFTMEIVKGETLLEHIKRGPLAPLRALSIAIGLGRVLMAVHGAGVIHRDVKPNNIILEADDRVRLLDFGICCLTSDYYRQPHLRAVTAEGDRYRTSELEFVGNAAYSDPQYFSEGLTAPQSDVFSVCVVVYEMITGRPLYDDRVRRHREIRAEEFAPELAPLVAELRRGVALAHERHSSMADLVRALEIVRSNITTRQPDPPAPSPPPAPTPWRARTWLALVCAAFLGGAAAAYLAITAADVPAPPPPELHVSEDMVRQTHAPEFGPGSAVVAPPVHAPPVHEPTSPRPAAVHGRHASAIPAGSGAPERPRKPAAPETWEARMRDAEAGARRCIEAAKLTVRRVIVTLSPSAPVEFANVGSDSEHARCIRDALDRLKIRSETRRRHTFFDAP